jgi:hypothetical protein
MKAIIDKNILEFKFIISDNLTKTPPPLGENLIRFKNKYSSIK